MLEWRKNNFIEGLLDLYLNGKRIGWMQKRPAYCDRGRWQFNSDLPGLDAADGFPRYYMNLDRAKAEAEDWSLLRMRTYEKRT